MKALNSLCEKSSNYNTRNCAEEPQSCAGTQGAVNDENDALVIRRKKKQRVKWCSKAIVANLNSDTALV